MQFHYLFHKIIFHNITIFVVFLANKCRLGEHNIFFNKKKNSIKLEFAHNYPYFKKLVSNKRHFME